MPICSDLSCSSPGAVDAALREHESCEGPGCESDGVASFGPASWTKSNDIGQLIRIASCRPALHLERPRRAERLPVTSPQTWQPWTTWTIVSRTVARRGRRAGAARAATTAIATASTTEPAAWRASVDAPRHVAGSRGTTDPAADYCHPRARALDPRRPPLPRARARSAGSPSSPSASLASLRAADAALERLHRPRHRLRPRAASILERDFGERPDGVFTVVFRAHPSDRRCARASSGGSRAAARARAHRPRATAPGRRRRALRRASTRRSTSSTRRATRPTLRRALARRARARYVTGQPAIQHDLEPILSSDLRRGEAIALPIALLVLARRARPLARRARSRSCSRPARSRRRSPSSTRSRTRSRWSATSRTSSS